MLETLLALDGNILLWIQDNLRADWLSPVMIRITKLGNIGFIWILLCLILLCFKKTRWAGAAGLLGLVFSLAVNNVCLKRLFARTRPYEVVDGLVLLTKKATDFSFPSGHTAASFASVTALYLAGEKKLWKPALALAILIAFSRMYLYVHYPTDTLGGVIFGSLSAWIGYQCSKKYVQHL